MSRIRTVVEKTHLVVQMPHIHAKSTRVEYWDRIVCGKDFENVDSTQILRQVDCKTCRSYIDARARVTYAHA